MPTGRHIPTARLMPTGPVHANRPSACLTGWPHATRPATCRQAGHMPTCRPHVNMPGTCHEAGCMPTGRVRANKPAAHQRASQRRTRSRPHMSTPLLALAALVNHTLGRGLTCQRQAWQRPHMSTPMLALACLSTTSLVEPSRVNAVGRPGRLGGCRARQHQWLWSPPMSMLMVGKAALVNGKLGQGACMPKGRAWRRGSGQ